MKPIMHATAGAVALLCIATFWTSTVVAEFFMASATILTVKTMILYGIVLLVPALMFTGASGFALARRRKGGLIARKLRRMPFIAANGFLILIPAAWWLQSKAAAGEFDASFLAVQGLELAAGAVNFTLLVLNFRDGLRLHGSLRE
jgi:hypothetical protein